MHAEAAGTPRTLQRGFVDVHPVHLGLRQQHGQRGRESAGAAAEVDDDPARRARGRRQGRGWLRRGGGGRRRPGRARPGRARTLPSRPPARADSRTRGGRPPRPAPTGRRTSPRSRQPRPRHGRSRPRAGRARPRRASRPTVQQPGRIADMYDVAGAARALPQPRRRHGVLRRPGWHPDPAASSARRCADTITQPLSNRGAAHAGRAQRRRRRARGPGGGGRPAGRGARGGGLRAQHDPADLRHLPRAGQGLGARRRDRRHPARPRRQRAALGASPPRPPAPRSAGPTSTPTTGELDPTAVAALLTEAHPAGRASPPRPT